MGGKPLKALSHVMFLAIAVGGVLESDRHCKGPNRQNLSPPGECAWQQTQ